MERILIIGFGNPLMKDEGVAISAVERLREMNLPENISLMDGGTSGMTLLHVLDDFDRIVMIDAADFGSSAGSVRKFDLDTTKFTQDSAQISMHGVSLAGIINLAKTLGKKFPKLELVAIQPKEVEYGVGISLECRDAISKVMELLSDVFSSKNA